MLESTLVREKEFSFFPLPTIFSLLAKLREIYIAHKLTAVSWLNSCMQHSFQHQSIIIRREHIALLVFVLCLRCKAPGKDSAAEPAVAQWEKDHSSPGKTSVIWNVEKDRKIKTKKSQRFSSWSYDGAGYAAIMGRADSSKVAKCWNQAVTPRKRAHLRRNTECYATPKSAVPGKLVALVTSLPSSFQGFGSWWPFRGKYQRHWVWALSQRNSVCYSACARPCAHYVVANCMCTVTLAGDFSPNTWEPSQNLEPTWLRTTSGKDNSCLLFQNFSKSSNFPKAT